MGKIQLWNGKPLVRNGKVAVDPECCCGPSGYNCKWCPDRVPPGWKIIFEALGNKSCSNCADYQDWYTYALWAPDYKPILEKNCFYTGFHLPATGLVYADYPCVPDNFTGFVALRINWIWDLDMVQYMLTLSGTFQGYLQWRNLFSGSVCTLQRTLTTVLHDGWQWCSGAGTQVTIIPEWNPPPRWW